MRKDQSITHAQCKLWDTNALSPERENIMAKKLSGKVAVVTASSEGLLSLFYAIFYIILNSNLYLCSISPLLW